MKSPKQYAALIVISALGISFGYAIVRYNIAGKVPWSRLPLYVLNKAVSLAGFILLFVNFSGNKNNSFRQEVFKHIGISSFLLIVLHAIISLLIFSPHAYPKFFDENNWLTTFAALSMLSGIIAIILLWIYNMSFSILYKEKFTKNLKENIINTAILIIGIHLFFMGYNGWLTPEKWYGKLPPISLISFSLFLTGIGFKIFKKFFKTP